MSLIMDLLEKVKQDTGNPPIKKAAAPNSRLMTKPVDQVAKVLDVTDDDLKKFRIPKKNEGFVRKIQHQTYSQNVKAVLLAALCGVFLAGFVWMVINIFSHIWNAGTTREVMPETYVAVNPVVNAPKSVVRDNQPQLGIFYDQEDPICLLGGRILHVGDVWEENKIVAISQKEIMLRDSHGKIFYLKP